MWTVTNVNAVTPHYSDLAKYINSMEKAGWELKHVDNDNLYFKRKSEEKKS